MVSLRGSGISASTRWVAAAVGLGLVMVGCSGSPNAAERDAGAQAPTVVGLGEMAALPSAAPAAGFADGGGGLVGGVWTVPGMPGALGPADKGVAVSSVQQAQVNGARVRLTALADENPANFVVKDLGSKQVLWDSSQARDECVSDKESNSCSVPSGVLAVGGSYSVDTTQKGVTEQRVFTVTDASALSGSVNVGPSTQQIANSNGGFALGLGFSSGFQGATAETRSATVWDAGLAPGWYWTGIPGNVAGMSISDAGGYQGFSRIMTVRMGSQTAQLGCKPTGHSTPDQCSMMSGAATGASLTAVLATGTDGKSLVTDQSSGSNWEFDKAGRMTKFSAPGDTPVVISYRDATGGLLSKVSWDGFDWNVYYPGDKPCAGEVPPGFAASPDGYVCALSDGLGNGMRLFYTQPSGAKFPRVSRVLALPKSCTQGRDWDYGKCDPLKAAVVDYGWDASNRMFLSRDAAANLARSVGVLPTVTDPMTDPTLTITEYDPLNRISKLTMPVPKAGMARQVRTVAFGESDVPKEMAPATRMVTTSTQTTAGGAEVNKTVTGYDDRGRTIYQDSDGSVTKMVWDPLKMLTYATISNDQVSATEYDKQARVVASYAGPAAMFNLDQCAPNNPKRENSSCKPVKPANVVSSKTTYDQPGRVASGLTGFWYDNPDFSGAPATITGVNSVSPSGTAPGFSIDPPSGVGSDWSLRLTGATTLDRHQFNLKVDIGDSSIDGSLWLNGTYCAALVEGSGSCSYDNTPSNINSTDSPMQIWLDLSRRATAGSESPTQKLASISLQDLNNRKRYVLTNESTIQRVSAVTQTDGYDPLPDGSKSKTSRLVAVFNDPKAESATSSTSSGTSIAGEAWTRPEIKTVYEVAPNGGARVASQSSPTGESSTFTYWGQDDTPASLAHSSQIPDDVRGAAQKGQVKSVTDLTGRTSTFVYDASGNQRCISYTDFNTGDPGSFSCTEEDADGQLTATIERANHDAPEIRTEYSSKYGHSPDQPFQTSTVTTTTGGKNPQTQTIVTNAADALLSYTDSLGTITSYDYDPYGQIIQEAVKPANDPKTGASYPAQTIDYVYRPDGLIDTMNIPGSGNSAAPTAKVSYQEEKDDAPTLASVAYSNGMRLDNEYDKSGLIAAQNWTLADGSKVKSSAVITLSQFMLSEKFDGVTNTFTFDGGSRLTNATVSGTDYTYSYDPANRRTCSAAAIPNPKKSDCAGLDGHTEYSYNPEHPDTLTATKGNPDLAIPATNPYNGEGGLNQVGGTKFTYDANNQLVAATNPTTGDLAISRDGNGRPTSITSPETPAPTPTPQPTPATSSPTPTSTAAPTPTSTTAHSDRTSPPTSPPTQTPAPAAGDSTTPTTAVEDSGQTTDQFGYAGPAATSPIIKYTQTGPQLLLALPGGLAAIGDALAITSPSGLGALRLTTSGHRISPASQFTGPYGETQTPAGQPLNPAHLYTENGARTLHTQLGQFLQPDPSVFAAGPQYNYTPADPVNYADPSGHQWNEKNKHRAALPQWAQFIIAIGMNVIGYGVMSIGMSKAIAKSTWLAVDGSLQSMTVFTLYTLSSAGFTILSTLVTNNFDLHKVWGWSWAVNGIMNTISGTIGLYSWKAKVFLNNATKAVTASKADAMAEINKLKNDLMLSANGILKDAENNLKQQTMRILDKIDQISDTALNQTKTLSASLQKSASEAVETGKQVASYAKAASFGYGVGKVIEVTAGLPGMAELGMMFGPAALAASEYVVSKVPVWWQTSNARVIYRFITGHGLPIESNASGQPWSVVMVSVPAGSGPSKSPRQKGSRPGEKNSKQKRANRRTPP